jgi:hypothetical protein
LYTGLRRQPSVHAGVALLFAAHLLFYLAYEIPDKELMLLPTYLCWAIWVAIGAPIFCRALSRTLSRGVSVPAATLLFGLALGCLVLNFPRRSQ